jgi:hypothetical protein
MLIIQIKKWEEAEEEATWLDFAVSYLCLQEMYFPM